MVTQGRVQNGVIVLAEGVSLPEGQLVTVLAQSTASPNGHGVLDIQRVSLGAIAQPIHPDDDLLAEMLDGRP
jgi:hypothetical protein